MSAIYLNPTFGDAERRRRLYEGDLVLLADRPAVRALAEFAYGMVGEAFAPHDPLVAQHEMPVERWVEIFAPLKPQFIHHPKTIGLVRDMVEEAGCDLDDVYIDVPRLRGVTSDGYLTSGVGYAHHPHRDTWYSAPMAQLNWWFPLAEFESGSAMAFHPRYWSEAVRNESSDFDYYEWNAVGRADAAKHIKADTRKQPRPLDDLELDPQVRVVCPVGSVLVFSPAHLHSAVSNTTGRTRFSIDVRTVSLSDLREGRAAPNLDSHPRGTSLRDFRRASDLAPMPDDIVARYDVGSESEGVLVFNPSES
jgi:hypothetical protein